MENKHIGLFLNGLEEWYQNIKKKFHTHGSTWIQQSKIPKDNLFEKLQSSIRQYGFFYAFGYVQQPYSKVRYRFKICKIVHEHGKRIPPPDDDIAPEFSDYDKTQGKCKPGKLEYPMWLQVSDMKEIQPVDKTKFVNVNNNRPIKSVRGNPHYVVYVTPELIDEELTVTDTSQQMVEHEIPDNGMSISLEKDLQHFIAKNVETIEEELELYPEGIEYQVSTGVIDILCTDENNTFTVIELKAGKASLRTFAQIKSYIAGLKTGVAKDSDVRGIIIAGNFDDNLRVTVEHDNKIKLLRYDVKFSFDEIV